MGPPVLWYCLHQGKLCLLWCRLLYYTYPIADPKYMGIHCNSRYSEGITQINLDDHNRIPTTDFRLIRRIVRDHQFRNSNAESTLEKWASVRRGEERNIFPYQEEADVMFNSASVYELSVLKPMAIKLLRKVDEDSCHYLDALRLRKFLQYFHQ